jgi:hypothetical protein
VKNRFQSFAFQNAACSATSWVLQSLAQIYIEKISVDTPTTTGGGLHSC